MKRNTPDGDGREKRFICTTAQCSASLTQGAQRQSRHIRGSKALCSTMTVILVVHENSSAALPDSGARGDAAQHVRRD